MTVTQAEPSRSTEDAVRPFADLRREDVDYAGGKGANLGELTSAGLPVPDGFVVGAPAYAAFLIQTGLRERLAQLLDEVDVEDTAALQAASATAQQMVYETPLPEDLVQEITVRLRAAGRSETARRRSPCAPPPPPRTLPTHPSRG